VYKRRRKYLLLEIKNDEERLKKEIKKAKERVREFKHKEKQKKVIKDLEEKDFFN